jgi:IS5 family transposase
MRTNSQPLSFADFLMQPRLKVTRTDKFLQDVLQLVDFSFTAKIHEQIHAAVEGRTPYDALRLFKILLLQQWFGLSDAAAEEQVYDRKSFQEFLGLVASDSIPDESTIGRFRKSLVDTKLDTVFFAEVLRQVESRGLKIDHGVSVDAMIVEVPKGRKKKDGTSSRDPEASFTKKNGRSYHGYKGHNATDTMGDFIVKTHTSTAKDHDSIHLDKVTDGAEKALFADSAYQNKAAKQEFRKQGRFYGVIEKAKRSHPLSGTQKAKNHQLSSVRCRVEHPFAEIRIRMRFEARYRGLRKNEWHWRMVTAAYNLKRMVGKFFPAQKQAVVWCQ